MSRIPPDFKLPRGNLQTAWICYCCWDKRRGIPPLRAVYGKELQRKLTSRFTRYTKLMEAIRNQAIHQNVWKEPDDEIAAVDILRKVDLSTIVPSTTRYARRQRRLDQLSWSTLAKDFYDRHRCPLVNQQLNADDDSMLDLDPSDNDL